jgi:Enoyl-CoA hydratase/isomerase
MKLGVALPIADIGGEPVALCEFAQAAEDIGYHGIAAPDHVFGVNVAGRPGWQQSRGCGRGPALSRRAAAGAGDEGRGDDPAERLRRQISLRADTAQFQDSAHFASDVVPGDGMHIVYPLLLGINRGRYFLLTGQTLDAAAAHRLGLVAEVLPAEKPLARARELAEALTKKPTLLLRYTRLLFTEYLRRQMHELLGYGLAMESLALIEKPEAAP